ncbi:MAG: hypothetical protein IPJ76_01255 [Flavobacteriales bacterium]|nr:MAG: hypothetical protein IPJ76_01255 [Flavobacteriales bacterium]
MKDSQIQYYNSVTRTHSTETIALGDFLRMSHLRDTIDELRLHEQGSVEYNTLKKTLPIVLFNVRTNGGKKNRDVISFNPFLFLDVDKIHPDHFDVVKQEILMSFPSVLMCWRSSGGRGLGILIHTRGIEDRNWSSLRDHFAPFSFHGYRFDPSCFTRTRPTFISIDDDAFVNWEAPPLDLSHLTATQSYATPPPTPKKKNSEKAGMGKDGGLRFSDIDRFFTNEDQDTPYLYFPNGVMLVQVERSYRKIKAGDRNAFVFRNLIRILHLNPFLSLPSLNALGRKLDERCEPRMGAEEITAITKKVFLNRYPAYPNVKRTFLFNPRIKKSPREKQSEARRKMNQAKGEQTAARIYQFIEGYTSEKKLTNRMIMEGTGIPLRTVERHARQFRGIIDHNHRTRAEARPIQAEATVLPEDRLASGKILAGRIERFMFPLPAVRVVLLARCIS